MTNEWTFIVVEDGKRRILDYIRVDELQQIDVEVSLTIITDVEAVSGDYDAFNNRALSRLCEIRAEIANARKVLGTELKAVKKAALAVAYDNGLVHRYRPEQDFLDRVWALCSTKDPIALLVYEYFLRAIGDADLETLCCGEDEDQKKLAALCPRPGLTEFLNEVFEL